MQAFFLRKEELAITSFQLLKNKKNSFIQTDSLTTKEEWMRAPRAKLKPSRPEVWAAVRREPPNDGAMGTGVETTAVSGTGGQG